MMTYDLGKYYAIIADESKENLKFFLKNLRSLKRLKIVFLIILKVIKIY